MQTSLHWHTSGSAFIQSVSKLLERLLDYRHVMDSHDDQMDKQMTCIVNLLVSNFEIILVVIIWEYVYF